MSVEHVCSCRRCNADAFQEHEERLSETYLNAYLGSPYKQPNDDVTWTISGHPYPMAHFEPVEAKLGEQGWITYYRRKELNGRIQRHICEVCRDSGEGRPCEAILFGNVSVSRMPDRRRTIPRLVSRRVG